MRESVYEQSLEPKSCSIDAVDRWAEWPKCRGVVGAAEAAITVIAASAAPTRTIAGRDRRYAAAPSRRNRSHSAATSATAINGTAV